MGYTDYQRSLDQKSIDVLIRTARDTLSTMNALLFKDLGSTDTTAAAETKTIESLKYVHGPSADERRRKLLSESPVINQVAHRAQDKHPTA